MTYDQAVRRAGSINKLASLLGVTRQAIQSYRKHGVPEERATQLQAALAARKKKA